MITTSTCIVMPSSLHILQVLYHCLYLLIIWLQSFFPIPFILIRISFFLSDCNEWESLLSLLSHSHRHLHSTPHWLQCAIIPLIINKMPCANLMDCTYNTYIHSALVGIYDPEPEIQIEWFMGPWSCQSGAFLGTILGRVHFLAVVASTVKLP